MRFSPQGFIDYEVPVQGIQPNQRELQQSYPEQYYDDEGQPQPQMPFNPNAVYPGQEEGFLKWLFNFRREAIIPLRNIWRGKEYDFENERWTDGKGQLRVMNEDGVTWGISLIESYMNPSFIVTDLDEKTYCFRMREATKVIWNSLCLRYKEFDLKKSDIHRVAEEIESKISAILRGALNDGYRSFFSTQNQEVTHRNLSPQQQLQQPTLINKMASFFRKNN